MGARGRDVYILKICTQDDTIRSFRKVYLLIVEAFALRPNNWMVNTGKAGPHPWRLRTRLAIMCVVVVDVEAKQSVRV